MARKVGAGCNPINCAFVLSKGVSCRSDNHILLINANYWTTCLKYRRCRGNKNWKRKEITFLKCFLRELTKWKNKFKCQDLITPWRCNIYYIWSFNINIANNADIWWELCLQWNDLRNNEIGLYWCDPGLWGWSSVGRFMGSIQVTWLHLEVKLDSIATRKRFHSDPLYTP